MIIITRYFLKWDTLVIPYFLRLPPWPVLPSLSGLPQSRCGTPVQSSYVLQLLLGTTGAVTGPMWTLRQLWPAKSTATSVQVWSALDQSAPAITQQVTCYSSKSHRAFHKHSTTVSVLLSCYAIHIWPCIALHNFEPIHHGAFVACNCCSKKARCSWVYHTHNWFL